MDFSFKSNGNKNNHEYIQHCETLNNERKTDDMLERQVASYDHKTQYILGFHLFDANNNWHKVKPKGKNHVIRVEKSCWLFTESSNVGEVPLKKVDLSIKKSDQNKKDKTTPDK